MAVVGVAKSIPTGRGGEDLENGRKRFTRTYLVRTDAPTDGPSVVLSAVGLPAMYDPYDGHEPALCVGRFPRPLEGTMLAWHVECEWDTHYTDRADHPLLEKPEIEWGFEPYDQALAGTARPGANIQLPAGSNDDGSPKFLTAEEFQWGHGILNAAGDPFPEPPVIPAYYPVVRVTRNEPVFLAHLAVLYGNTINKTAWSLLAPRQAYLKPLEATNQVHRSDRFDTPDVLYWKVRYTFVLKADSWLLALLNVGERYLETAGNFHVRKKFKDLDGHPEIGLLKADGTRYATNEEKKPTFAVYPVRREIDFAGLGINLNAAIGSWRRPPR